MARCGSSRVICKSDVTDKGSVLDKLEHMTAPMRLFRIVYYFPDYKDLGKECLVSLVTSDDEFICGWTSDYKSKMSECYLPGEWKRGVLRM